MAYVARSGRWNPWILFWSNVSLFFGAGLEVAALLFSFGLTSRLERVWRCPWVCLHDHERMAKGLDPGF